MHVCVMFTIHDLLQGCFFESLIEFVKFEKKCSNERLGLSELTFITDTKASADTYGQEM